LDRGSPNWAERESLRDIPFIIMGIYRTFESNSERIPRPPCGYRGQRANMKQDNFFKDRSFSPPKADSGELQFKVSGNDEGLRLDIFLSRRDIPRSRSQVQRLIEEGRVHVNGSDAKASHRLRAGDTVVLRETEPQRYDVIPEDIPLKVLYEDASLIVVDKPAGMVVHPATGNFKGTLVNALLFHCHDLSGIGGVLRPGIVHRLDKDTSGLLVVAKSDAAHQSLTMQFRDHLVQKRYRALVFGDPGEEGGVVDSSVGRHPTDRKKMSTRSRRGKEALTRWTVAERYGIVTLLDVEIETGRTHQIRVHLHSIGYPVLGDRVYGNAVQRLQGIQDTFLRARLKGMKRQALHAGGLGFVHPVTDQFIEFSSPLPGDMAGICAFLRDRNCS
jgi:23S rRNA pseudouridine1911/1915/1917 synthase